MAEAPLLLLSQAGYLLASLGSCLRLRPTPQGTATLPPWINKLFLTYPLPVFMSLKIVSSWPVTFSGGGCSFQQIRPQEESHGRCWVCSCVCNTCIHPPQECKRVIVSCTSFCSWWVYQEAWEAAPWPPAQRSLWFHCTDAQEEMGRWRQPGWEGKHTHLPCTRPEFQTSAWPCGWKIMS